MKDKCSKWFIRPNWMLKALAVLFSVCFCATFALDMNYCMKNPAQEFRKDFSNRQGNFIQITRSPFDIFGRTDKFDDSEVNQFDEKSNVEFIKSYRMYIDLSSNDHSSTLYDNVFPDFYRDCISANSMSKLPSSYKVLEGKLPEAENEIMLTDFQYCYFKYNGYNVYGESILPENITMKSLLGRKIISEYSIIGDLTISGFLSTGFDVEHSDDFVTANKENGSKSVCDLLLLDKYIVSEKLENHLKDARIYKYNLDCVYYKNETIGAGHSVQPYFRVQNELTLNQSVTMYDNVKDSILLPVRYFSEMLEHNEEKKTVTMPKEFIYGASEDVVKEMSLFELFDSYVTYAALYYAEENYKDIYSKNLSFMDEYGERYFKTKDLKPVDEWTDQEKKDVLINYLVDQHDYTYLKEYFFDDAKEFIDSYSKKYLKHFYMQYENDIFHNDKTLKIEPYFSSEDVIATFTFNGFNLNDPDGKIALIDKDNIDKLISDAGHYYSSLISRTEGNDLKDVFSYLYSKENHDEYLNYKYFVGNVDTYNRSYISWIDEMKSPITKVMIMFAVLALVFIVVDAKFMKRKNERKFYLIASSENAKENCFKTALFNTLPWLIVIYVLSLPIYECSILIAKKYSRIAISFEPLNILFIFLIALVVGAVLFLAVYILLLELKNTHEKAMQIKEKQNNE